MVSLPDMSNSKARVDRLLSCMSLNRPKGLSEPTRSAGLMRITLFYGDRHKNARVVAHGSRNMALTASIVCQIDIAGTEAALGAIADLDLTFTGKIDDILPSRRPMPGVEIVGENVAEDDTTSVNRRTKRGT
jgi:hypothetical protein